MYVASHHAEIPYCSSETDFPRAITTLGVDKQCDRRVRSEFPSKLSLTI